MPQHRSVLTNSLFTKNATMAPCAFLYPESLFSLLKSLFPALQILINNQVKFFVFFWTLDLAEVSWELFKEGKSTGWVFLISLWSFLFVNCLKRIKNSKLHLNTPDLVEFGNQIWEHVCHRPLFWSMHLFVPTPNGTFSAMQLRNQKPTKWMGLLSAWIAWIHG